MLPTDSPYHIHLEDLIILGKKYYTFSYFTPSLNKRVYLVNSKNNIVHFTNIDDGLRILNDILLVYLNCVNIKEIKNNLYNINYE